MDGALLLLAVTSSFVPLAWMAIRGATIERDDLLYSLMLWKYYAVFLAFRFAGCTRKPTCLRTGITKNI